MLWTDKCTNRMIFNVVWCFVTFSFQNLTLCFYQVGIVPSPYPETAISKGDAFSLYNTNQGV